VAYSKVVDLYKLHIEEYNNNNNNNNNNDNDNNDKNNYNNYNNSKKLLRFKLWPILVFVIETWRPCHLLYFWFYWRSILGFLFTVSSFSGH